MQLALPVERKIIVTFIAAVLAMHQWHDGFRRLYGWSDRMAIFFERRSNVSDILANDSGCTRFST
jgi:predicted transcriptional regulator